MTLLKRHLAPIDKGVWNFIEEEARSVLELKLTGRKVVDTIGPKGLDYAAYNTGRINSLPVSDEGADYFIRDVLPLVQLEVPFSIKRNEIEALLRGARDVEIDDLQKAADKLSSIENNALYYGLTEAGIEGLTAVSDHSVVVINENTGILTPITAGIQALRREKVKLPYNFVVGPYLYSLLHQFDEKGYPLERKIETLIGGKILFSEELGDQGLLLGSRDDDFQLILGQDISIGFKGETDEEIEFFITESFTFKANAGEAVVVFGKE